MTVAVALPVTSADLILKPEFVLVELDEAAVLDLLRAFVELQSEGILTLLFDGGAGEESVEGVAEPLKEALVDPVAIGALVEARFGVLGLDGLRRQLNLFKLLV